MSAKELTDLLDAISKVSKRMSCNMKRIMARKEKKKNVGYYIKAQRCSSVDCLSS